MRVVRGCLVVQRRTDDREFTGSSLTHCVAEYMPLTRTNASVTEQYNLVPVGGVDALKPERSSVTLAMRH